MSLLLLQGVPGLYLLYVLLFFGLFVVLSVGLAAGGIWLVDTLSVAGGDPDE